ncbi:two-component response regulator ORR21-like [Punica granatum]|uniref:Uncharacterized protein n=2 Tax=Punica granatum TaxID=22663 RepID=A0A2I0HVR1_PUNGR|nr:two-component response regulator ORR21-like [Punica granatum]PKI35785.1 hypothetical protein CRG98_043820 [Punica granatum]
MSADDRDYIMLRCLEQGAVFFMSKPIHPEELKNVWQYAVKGRKGKSIPIERIARPIPGSGPLGLADSGPSSNHHHRQLGATSALSSNNLIRDSSHPNRPQNPNEVSHDCEKQQQEPEKRKVQDKGQTSTEKPNKRPYMVPTPRKMKISWTAPLHYRFLQALSIVGSVEKAVPKKVLDLMNVPGLTRENVASHLQKYRLFLKEVAESAKSQGSTSPTGFPPMIENEPDITPGVLDIRTPRPLEALQPNHVTFSIHDYYRSHRASLFPGKPPLNPNIVSNYGSLGRPIAPLPKANNRRASWKKSITVDGSNHCGLYQPDRSALTTAPMDRMNVNGAPHRNSHLKRNYASLGSGYSTQGPGNSSQTHQQENLLAPKRFASRLLGYGQAASGMSNIDSIIGSRGSFANYLIPPSSAQPNENSNYAGIRLTGNGDLLGLGQPHKPNIAAIENNEIYAGFGSMGGIPPRTEKATLLGQGTSNSNCFSPGESSTSKFWLASPSEVFPSADDQGLAAPKEVENPFALEELIKTVLGENDDNPDHLIPGEGSSNSFPLENAVNYHSALPTQDHGKNPISDVGNGSYQVQVNAQRNEVVNSDVCHSYSGEGNSSAWDKPSPGQYLVIDGDFIDEEIAYLCADFFPVFDKNPNQLNSISQEQGSGNNFNAVTNNTMQSAGNLTTNASEEKEFDEDFINSVLDGVEPYLNED